MSTLALTTVPPFGTIVRLKKFSLTVMCFLTYGIWLCETGKKTAVFPFVQSISVKQILIRATGWPANWKKWSSLFVSCNASWCDLQCWMIIDGLLVTIAVCNIYFYCILLSSREESKLTFTSHVGTPPTRVGVLRTSLGLPGSCSHLRVIANTICKRELLSWRCNVSWLPFQW